LVVDCGSGKKTSINFLAHLTLSYFEPDLQVGNFLGDFVKGARVSLLPDSVIAGIEMHRAIDKLTDQDEDVRSLNTLLKPKHGRYASVITDISFDYYLWRNWEAFGPLPFEEFCQSAYANLYERRDHMDDRVRGYVNGMVKDNWLRLYTTREGMSRVFDRLRPRLSQPHLLNGIDTTLLEFHEDFNQTFLALFPRLQTLATTYAQDSSSTN